MRIELTEEQQMIQQAVRDFVQNEVAPHAAEIDRTERFPIETIRKAGELNLLGVAVDEHHDLALPQASRRPQEQRRSRQLGQVGPQLVDASEVLIRQQRRSWQLDHRADGRIDAYALTLAATLLIFGSLADRLGRRRVFAWGLAAFSLASISLRRIPVWVLA